MTLVVTGAFAYEGAHSGTVGEEGRGRKATSGHRTFKPEGVRGHKQLSFMQRKRLRRKGTSLPPLEAGQELSVPKSVLNIVAKFSHSFCKCLYLHTSRG